MRRRFRPTAPGRAGGRARSGRARLRSAASTASAVAFHPNGGDDARGAAADHVVRAASGGSADQVGVVTTERKIGEHYQEVGGAAASGPERIWSAVDSAVDHSSARPMPLPPAPSLYPLVDRRHSASIQASRHRWGVNADEQHGVERPVGDDATRDCRRRRRTANSTPPTKIGQRRPPDPGS